MKRDRVLEETRRGLAKTGFCLSRPHGERGLCFDFVARRDDTLLNVKVLQNVDALSKDTAHELLEVARILEGSPLVVGERSGTGSLEDGVIYTRFGVSILSRRTLGEFLEEGIPPFLYSAPGGLYVRLDADALRRAVEPRGHDVPHRRRGCGPSARTEGGGRVEPEPRGRERLGHVRRTRPGSDEHPRRPRHRARGAAPRERPRRCRGDDLREEGLMDEVRLGLASVTILPVVRGLPSETSTVAEAIRTTNPKVVALSIGPEELQTLRVYHGGPLEPENFEEEIYVAGLSAWEPPVKPPPCFTEAVRIADKRGTRLEALDMD